METTSNSIEIFENRLLYLDEKITNYSKKSLDETIGKVQERVLAQDQDFEPISEELKTYTYDCSKKLDELHVKLKNKEIPKEEIPKLKEQLIQMHKTISSFDSHVSSNPQQTFHSGKEKLVDTLSAQLELLADDILNNYERILVYSNDSQQEILDLPCSPFYKLSQAFSRDKESSMEQLKNFTPTPTTPIIPYPTMPQMNKVLIPVCEWFEKNQEGIGDQALRSDTFLSLLEYSLLTHNTVLQEQCEAFAIASLREAFNHQEMTINGEKWLEYASLLTAVDLPKLKQACIETFPYVKVDLTKTAGRQCLLDIAALIKKSNLPGGFSHYPPVNLIATNGDKIPVDFVKLLQFSGTFQNMMEDLNYKYSPEDIIQAYATPDQIKTLVEWMDGDYKSSPINELNWKDLLQLANFWDVKDLKEQCEQFGIEEINRDHYPEEKYTKEELKQMIILAKRTDSERLLYALLGKWKP